MEKKKINIGDYVFVTSFKYLELYNMTEYLYKPVSVIKPTNDTKDGYINVSIPNNDDGGLNVPLDFVEKCNDVNNKITIITKCDINYLNQLSVVNSYILKSDKNEPFVGKQNLPSGGKIFTVECIKDALNSKWIFLIYEK